MFLRVGWTQRWEKFLEILFVFVCVCVRFSFCETPRNRRFLEAQTSRNTPSSSLIARHHLEATHDHTCDQDENRGSLLDKWPQKKTCAQLFDPRPVPGQSRRMCVCLVVLLFPQLYGTEFYTPPPHPPLKIPF